MTHAIAPPRGPNGDANRLAPRDRGVHHELLASATLPRRSPRAPRATPADEF